MDDVISLFESINKFNGECEKEITKLVKFSKNDQENVQLFISSAVVLLGAKFESCIESLIEEYVYKINSEANKEKIPNELKYSSIHNKFCIYKENIKSNHFDYSPKDVEFLNDFSNFVRAIMNNSSDLKINNKFSYGKHGYKELDKLFQNIAIDINDKKFDKFVENGLFPGISQEKSFKDEFNRFTNNRNIVIHQNQCPNITGDDIMDTVDIFRKFIKKVGIELNDRLQNMK
ncbi:MAG: HEPN domain-containing protein [Treponema sp.]